MIKTKLTFNLIILLLIIFLASCEGYTYREWKVSNESSTTIMVKAGLLFESDTVYHEIETGQEKIITITTEDKGDSEVQLAYDVFSSFLITNKDTLTTDMNFADNDSWDIWIEQTKSNPPHYEQIYTLIVTNADFQ